MKGRRVRVEAVYEAGGYAPPADYALNMLKRAVPLVATQLRATRNESRWYAWKEVFELLAACRVYPAGGGRNA